MIVNRVGDVGLLLGIVALYTVFATLEFSSLFPLVPYFVQVTVILNTYILDILLFVTLCFLVGVAGKSAQFGLHT
jgi:NADH-quinone oxidoreductase subunit L